MGWIREFIAFWRVIAANLLGDAIKHVRDHFWRSCAFFMLAVIFWVEAFPTVYRLVVPPSRFLELNGLSIPNTAVGEPISVDLKREVKRNFRADMRTILLRHDPIEPSTIQSQGPIEGTIWSYCDGGRDGLPYTAGLLYPGRPLTWWLGAPPDEPCIPEAGKYSVRIEFGIGGFWGWITLYQSVESDVFYMYDPSLTQNVTPGLSPLILEGVQP